MMDPNVRLSRKVIKRLCVKIVSIRLKRDLIGYAAFLLFALVKRSQTTLHTASETSGLATTDRGIGVGQRPDRKKVSAGLTANT